MNLKRHFRLRHIGRSIQFFVKETFMPGPVSCKPKTLLLIKTEAIGDYILFRDFLKYTRTSAPFRDYKITLLGNEVWKPLAEKFDAGEVDDLIFVSKERLKHDAGYRKQVLHDIRNRAFETVVNCTFSREFLLGDSVVKASAAPHRIGMLGDDASEVPFLFRLGSAAYTRLIPNDGAIFEFDRNRHFFNQLLNENITIARPHLDPGNISKENIAVLLPGAQAKYRQWPAHKFKQVAEYLHQAYGMNIILSGSANESGIAGSILSPDNAGYIQDRLGKTGLGELPGLLASARIVVCNDSGTLHMAAAVNTPTVCISNANHYLRFTPYPENAGGHLKFVYPPSFLTKKLSPGEAYQEMRYGSNLDIDEIEFDEVKKNIDFLLAG